jgi:long-chain acyl-CoA synthetase
VGLGRDLRLTCERLADRIAVVTDRERLTYGQLLEQSDRIAGHFHSRGVKAGDYVGLALQDSLDTLLAILACWRLAATVATLDFRAPRGQRMATARDFNLVTVFESVPAPGEGDYPREAFDRSWRDTTASVRLPPPGDDENPAFLLFTSGTTGAPKAYVQSHDVLAARIATRGALLDSAEMRFLTPMALTYSATRHQIFGYLVRGGTVRLLPPLFSPSELAEELLAFGATGTALPPPVIARLVREAGARSTPLFPRLSVLASMGGPAKAEDKVAAYLKLSDGYRMGYASGLTGMIATLSGADVLRKPETTGRAAGGSRIAIVDDSGHDVAPGQRGRIKAWTKSMATAIVMPGGIVTTDPATMGPDWGIPGDLGYLDEDGFLTIVDREGDVIVRGGVNVAPLELERVIARHPKVVEVAVVGYPDDEMGQEIAAFIVSDGGSVEEFARYVATNIAPDRRPRRITLVPSLPYSEHGKLLRRRLIEMLAVPSAPDKTG